MNRIFLALLLLVSQDTLRVKVSLVTVGVRVTDSRARDVRGLKKENFNIFDDGVRQKIQFFSSDEQPIMLGILLDHSDSMSYNEKLDRAKEAARVLAAAPIDGSEFFYIVFDDQVKVVADVTTDRPRIDSAIEATKLGGGTSLYDAVLKGLEVSNRARLPRQALVIISDGADQHSIHSLDEVIHAVRQAEMQVYTIGYFSKDEDRFFRSSGAKLNLAGGRVIANPRHVLEKLAKDSGAESFFPRSDADLAKDVEKIANDLRTQYTLAFYPTSDSDNHYHQLRVGVPGTRYNVRARPGYGANP